MTKTGTETRAAALPALGAGAALSAMIFASRLPATLDFILPRRAGWFVFETALSILSSPAGREIFTVAVTLSFVAALARFGFLIAGAVRGRKWSARDFLARGLRVALVLALMRASFTVWFEVSQNAWFPFGSMNALEPFANFLVCAAISFLTMRSSVRLLGAKPPSLVRELAPWASGATAAAVLAWAACGAWASPVPAGAGVSAPRRLIVVLIEEEGRPAQTAYDIPATPDAATLDALESGLSKAPASRLQTLRFLYEARAKLMDADGLRRVLLAGARQDDLARSLLLAHLTVAAPGPDAVAALSALADEGFFRVGPMGAARLALAYARLGDRDLAARWAKKASAGPRGVLEGLLDLSGGGALKPGRVAGRVDGLRPLRVALYRKSDPAAPYLLDAAGLVASAEPDAKGRFAFNGLQAGRYYLAFAFARPDAPRGEIRVSGHRGDLSLDARKASLDLPPLTIKLTSR